MKEKKGSNQEVTGPRISDGPRERGGTERRREKERRGYFEKNEKKSIRRKEKSKVVV